MPIPSLQKRQYGHLSDEPIKKYFKPKRNKLKILKFLVIFSLILICLGFIAGTVLTAWATRDLPDPNKLSDRQVSESTKIYDRTGTHLLYEVFQDQKRTLVELDKISSNTQKATIAIEDKHFYEHKGVRIISIIRAGVNNLIGRRSGSGGASTITQQLIKNVVVGDERTYLRKIKEAIMAIRLEKKYSKDQILQMYLNEIPFGSTNYGVEAASQSFFRKKANEVSLAESATLAAIPKAPSKYLNNLTSLRERRDYILRLMNEQGYIGKEEMETAQNEALRIYRNSGVFDAPHFVLYVKQLLADQFGEQMIDSGGLKVITSLDYDKQKIAENTIKTLGDQNASSSNANNASLVAVDPKTGQVLAMVGSRDFNNVEIDGQFNVAVLGKLQPGSSLKPLIYTAAFAKGYTPDTVLYDVSTDFEDRTGSSYRPKNYSDKEYGLVTMRKALQGSLNISSVKTLYLVGVKNAIEFCQKFGYTTLNENAGLSLVLGGSEVNLLEHTNAYATLANNGVYNAPVNILKVTDKKGDVLYEWKPSDGTEAISSDLAATITNILTDNNARAYIFGQKNNLILPNRPVAAKTGTTNNNFDAWTLGYTPSLASGVWVGNTPKHLPMKAGGNALAGKIWNTFMSLSLASSTIEQFPVAPANTSTKPILNGTDRGIILSINSANGKIATSSTLPNLIIKRSFLPPHDILHYVNKDDPNGATPIKPDEDPQYENWEKGLQEWAQRETKAGREVSLLDPPTELDISQSSELTPIIEIISPTSSSIIIDRQIDIKITATSPQGISTVIYKIDNIQVGSTSVYPFDFIYNARKLNNGQHTLSVIASDPQNNWGQKDIVFNLNAPLDSPDVDWFDTSPLTLEKEDFPRVMYLNPYRWNDIHDVKIYLITPTEEKYIFYFNPAVEKLLNNKIFFTWNNYPGANNYTLKAVTTNKNNTVSKKEIQVVVQ